MFASYKALVLNAYQKKRDEGKLSPSLERPTPAKLKEECITVFIERYSKKDDKTLKSFFGPIKEVDEYVKLIKRVDTTKFKPLDNFLKGKTSEPDEKNVALLAWLIDFEPRPFKYGNTYVEELKLVEKEKSANFDDTDKEEDIRILVSAPDNEHISPDENKVNTDPGEKPNDKIGEKEESTSPIKIGETERDDKKSEEIAEEVHRFLIQQSQVIVTEIISPKKPALTSKFKKAIVSFILIIATGSGAYLFLGTKPQTSNMPQSFMSRNGNCMYWTGEQYQPISCDQKVSDTPIVPLDTVILAQLKKITNPDTITTQCLGKVWYVKINGEPEFYTSNGFHPVYTDKRLRPITPYIINKYVRH